MTTKQANHQLRQEEGCLDDLLKGSDYEPTNRYVDLQRDLNEFYLAMQVFVNKEEFQTHIKKDGYALDKIEEKLKVGKDDVLKTECPIVIAGETSAGKSTIINLILGENILPTGIKASTSRVCRVKYSERCMISTRSSNDEELENMSFENLQEMAENLKCLAKTNDEEIGYVDIHMPAPLLQGNVIIVDTPGCGDKEQTNVAEKTMSYLPNALAFVFVLNVANAGGIQDDRILPVLSKIRTSVDEMVSFSPEDVIFLLNKWETLSHNDANEQEEFFKETKESLQVTWKEVDEQCIFRISAKKIAQKKPKYTEVFDKFQMNLQKIIAKNENKRVKVHIRFLKGFLDECNRVISTKLACAMQSAEENKSNLDHLSKELETIEKTRKEEISNIDRRVETFIDEASQQFHDYIHHADFRAIVLNDTDKFTRLTIGKELNTRIENETKTWQKEHIENIILETILGGLLKKFENIHRSLHSIKENLSGFKAPFDVENKVATAVASGVLPSGAGILGSFLINRIVPHYGVFVGIAAAGILSGIVLSSLVTFDGICSFETVRDRAFQLRIDVFTKEKIKDILRKEYLHDVKEIISVFLQGDLVDEIMKIKENIITMKNKHLVFKSDHETLSSLQLNVIQNIERLEQIGRIDIISE